MNEIKLNKTQRSLVAVWQNEVQNVLRKVNQLASEVLAMKLEGLANECGIELELEEWAFDINGMRFYRVEKPKAGYGERKDVVPTIPGKKRGRPKKEDEIDVENGVSSDDEPPLPFSEPKD